MNKRILTTLLATLCASVRRSRHRSASAPGVSTAGAGRGTGAGEAVRCHEMVCLAQRCLRVLLDRDHSYSQPLVHGHGCQMVAYMPVLCTVPGAVLSIYRRVEFFITRPRPGYKK